MIAHLLIGLAVSLAVVWLALLAAVFLLRPKDASIGDLVRLMPDTLRLLRDLTKDRTLGWRARWRLVVAVAYNVQPINLIPDFIPVVGLLDNVVVIVWALRGVVRVAGPERVEAHWRGSAAGLEFIRRLCGIKVAAAKP